MVHFSTGKIIAILLACLLSIAYAVPNILGPDSLKSVQASLPSWLPTQTINLGLDLQGGSYRLLRVEYEDVLQQRDVPPA